jgi:Na+/H+ antiporter NhaA
LVAASGVAAPILVTAFLGDRSPNVLDGWRVWLAQNNATVMSILFLIFGVVLIGQGIEASSV